MLSTEVYVANPYNNIMKKVSGINEALSLIGFQNYNGYRIPNVYAGYDNSSLNPTYGELRVGTEKHTAKVIVFNVVSKEQGGDLYRVINTTRSNYITTVENTDGKRFERDNAMNTFGFPFNYDGDLYDVIEVLGWRSNQEATIKIDHSDVVKYPVVKVVYANDDELRIVDRYNDYTTLDIRDADIFTKLNKLENGSVIQFRVENHKTDKANNVAEIISILPKDTALEGSIKGVLPMVNAKQRVGKIIEVRPVDGLYSNVVIDVERDLLDADAMSGPQLFRVNKAVADKLAAYAGKADMFAFKVDYVYTDKGIQTAYDFRFNAGNKEVVPGTADVKIADVKRLVTDADAKYNPNKVTEQNLKEAKAAVAYIDEQIGKLMLDEKTDFDAAKAPYGTALKAIKDQISVLDVKAKIALIDVEADKLPKVADIKLYTEQNQVNEAAKAFNAVADEFNKLSAAEKATAEGVALKAKLNAISTEITTIDGKVETSVAVNPALKAI